MTTYAVGQRVLVKQGLRGFTEDKQGVIVSSETDFGGLVEYEVVFDDHDEKDYGWQDMWYSADELEPAPAAQATLTQALEALKPFAELGEAILFAEREDSMCEEDDKTYVGYPGEHKAAFVRNIDFKRAAETYRTLLQAASQPTDDADAAAGSEG